MGNIGENIKKLGFGLMRLPQEPAGVVDLELTKKLVDMFMERGFTYFDTAYGYINGESEKAVKPALVDRYPRESFQLATKLPAWAGAKTAEEAKQMFYTSLERTGAGYFDFYLLHNLGGNRVKPFDDFGIWDFVLDLKKQGLIKHVGFSLHDSAEVLDELLTKHPEMEFVQLQINYADWEAGAVQSRACLEVAQKHNKPVIIMEPIKGGALSNPADSVKKLFDEANPDASYASWAIRFAASQPNVLTVLSGMNTVEQMEDNTSYMQNFAPLTDDEMKVIEAVQAALAALPSIPCTSCRYCVPDCPQKLFISDIFNAMNAEFIYNDPEGAKRGYAMAQMFGSAKASECIECGLCESVCPQKIEIIKTLKDAAAKFE